MFHHIQNLSGEVFNHNFLLVTQTMQPWYSQVELTQNLAY